VIDATKLRWVPGQDSVRAALERAIGKWQGTPYRVGQQSPGVGVDCVRFVCAVLDDVTGRTTPIETLPQDASMHARTSAILTMKKIKQLYMPNAEVADGTIEAGDLLITAPEGGGPGHVLIAGPKPWHLWESTATGVRRTGLGGLTTGAAQRLQYVYRITNKDTWV